MPVVVVFFSALLLAAAPAHALTLEFENISNSGGGTPEQYVATFEDGGDGTVVFTASNLGPDDSSIVGIYFDDATDSVLSGILDIQNTDPTVLFAEGAEPPSLPLSGKVGFVTDFAAGATTPSGKPDTGVNQDESVTLVLALADGATYADLEAALVSGDLRVGLRVQGFDGTGPGSLVSSSVTAPLPEPGATLLFACGAGILALALRRAQR